MTGWWEEEEEGGANLLQVCAKVQEKAALFKMKKPRDRGTSGVSGERGVQKDTHAGHMQLAEKRWCCGGRPVQEGSEPTKAREKGRKNQIQSWRNSTGELW